MNINDKHIEVIVRQMLRWVKIKEVGDTEFLLEEQVDRFRFTDENERVRGEKGEVAQAEPLLLGITKASLSTDSFISAMLLVWALDRFSREGMAALAMSRPRSSPSMT